MQSVTEMTEGGLPQPQRADEGPGREAKSHVWSNSPCCSASSSSPSPPRERVITFEVFQLRVSALACGRSRRLAAGACSCSIRPASEAASRLGSDGGRPDEPDSAVEA